MINILTTHDDRVININTYTSQHTKYTSVNTYTLTGDDDIINNMWRDEYLYYTPVSGFWESPDRLEHELQTVRQVRDQALADTDWIVIRSTETEQPLEPEFTQYRAWLRDLPANYTPTQPVTCTITGLTGIDVDKIIEKLQPWTYVSVLTAEPVLPVDRQRIRHENLLRSVAVSGWPAEYYYESEDLITPSGVSITLPSSGDPYSTYTTNIVVRDIVISDDDEDPEVKQLDLSTIMMSPTG